MPKAFIISILDKVATQHSVVLHAAAVEAIVLQALIQSLNTGTKDIILDKAAHASGKKAQLTWSPSTRVRFELTNNKPKKKPIYAVHLHSKL